MKEFIIALVSGLVTGSLYAAMTVGMTMVYGVTRIFNFGHGLMAIMGGYFCYFFITGVGLPQFVAILTSIIVMYGLGALLFRFALKPLLKSDDWIFTILLFLMGLGLILENGILQIFGPRVKTIPRFIDGRIKFGYIQINWHDVVLIVTVIAMFIILYLFLYKTWQGKSMLAVSQDMDGARIVGINVDQTFTKAFAIATAITAFSGILLASKFYMTPSVGWSWMYRGFVIVTLGGLGSVWGGVLAALLMGTAEALIVTYFNNSWVMPIWFIMFVVILMARPQGLLGGRVE